MPSAVTVTAAGMTGSPKTIDVPVALSDGASEIALAIRTALAADADVSAMFNVSGATDAIVLTRNALVANDETLNIAIADGTSVGVATDATSANTTAGVAQDTDDSIATKIRAALDADEDVTGVFTVSGADNYVILTKDAVGANDATVNIAVEDDTSVGIADDTGSANTTAGVAQDTANSIATKIRAALAADADVSAAFDISGETDAIILTGKLALADDETLNVAIADDTCVGVTAAATSADTTAGVARDEAADIAGKIRTALTSDADVDALFTVSGSGTSVILTKDAVGANDATVNIAIDNGTCTGITAAATSANTTAGVAQDDASGIAGKIRAALAADTAVAAKFDVSGATDAIILTAKTEAANDATLNVAIDNDTCAGITTAATSANTTAGVAQDDAESVATKIAAALNDDTAVDALFTAASDGAEVTLTRDTVAANDATLNIAIANGTCAGLTAAATSESTTAGVAADAVKPIGVRGYDKITVCVKNSYNQTVKVSLGLYDGIGTGFDTDRIATTAVKSFATTVQDVYTAKDDTLLLYTIFKGIALKVIQDSTPPASGTMDVTVYGVRA